MPKKNKVLAVISSDLYHSANMAIERYLSSFEEISVLMDSADDADKILTRVGSRIRPIHHFDIRTYDRDIYYGISAVHFEAFERYLDTFFRTPAGRHLDINTEKLRIDYIDFLSAPMAESHSFSHGLYGEQWDRILFFVNPHSEDFLEFLRLGRALKIKAAYLTAVEDRVLRLRVLSAGRRGSDHPMPLDARRRKIGQFLQRKSIFERVRELLSSFVFVSGKRLVHLNFLPSTTVKARRADPVSLAPNPDIGIFKHAHKLLNEEWDGPARTMIMAEVQSRPYAETLAIALQHIPDTLHAIILAPTLGGALSKHFAKAIEEAAHNRLGPEGVSDAIVNYQATLEKPRTVRRRSKRMVEAPDGSVTEKTEDAEALYSGETIAVIRRAFPNIDFFYVDLRGIDSNFVTQGWIDRNRAEEKALITDAIRYQFDELPFRSSRLRASFERLAQNITLHKYQADLFAKEMFNRLDGKIETIVGFSGRHWLARIAAIEARRRGIKVVDWQCTILGKTPVFPKIIADRVLAIFKNAAELYESHFNFRKEQIDIVGFPRFMRRMSLHNRVDAEKLLARHGIGSHDIFHVFAAQPFQIGMQEHLLTQLAEAARAANTKILVCAHPSQRVNGQVGHLDAFVAKLPGDNIVFSTEFEASDLFIFAKSVIAYSSTFLFEVAHFGWSAILFDPFDDPHILDYKASSEIMSARSPGELAACLERAGQQSSIEREHIDFHEEELKCAALIWDGITLPIAATPR